MSIYFVRAEGIPLEQRRGLETIDRNLVFILVRGHPWSLIYKLWRSSIRIYLTEEDARHISELLMASVIY